MSLFSFIPPTIHPHPAGVTSRTGVNCTVPTHTHRTTHPVYPGRGMTKGWVLRQTTRPWSWRTIPHTSVTVSPPQDPLGLDDGATPHVSFGTSRKGTGEGGDGSCGLPVRDFHLSVITRVSDGTGGLGAHFRTGCHLHPPLRH